MSDDRMADMELFRAWCDGDQAAGNQLFDRHFESIYVFFSNKISDGADDLTQETFLACVRGRERFRGEASVRSYLFRTARQILYKAYRDRRRRDAFVDPMTTSVQDLALSPRSLVGHKHEVSLLLEALRGLPIDYQVALEMYYWEELTGPELAAALEIPVPALRSRLRRGIELLRGRLFELSDEQGALAGDTDLETWARSARRLITEQPPMSLPRKVCVHASPDHR